MLRGALAQYLHALFEQKENFTVYFSGEKAIIISVQTQHNDLFLPITIFFYENLKKDWPKKHA